MNMILKSTAAMAATAAIAEPALAALSAAAPEAGDPVIALSESLLEAWRQLGAIEKTPFEEAMIEWRQKNPRPEHRRVPMRPNTGYDLDGPQAPRP